MKDGKNLTGQYFSQRLSCIQAVRFMQDNLNFLSAAQLRKMVRKVTGVLYKH